MKILRTTIMALASAVCLTACANKKSDETMKQGDNKAGKVLVAFFSRTGENYSVGNISKGNTHIVAEMIAEATGADIFEIVPQKSYPTTYEQCTEVAEKEKTANARPAIKTDKDIAPYDTIYIGYPIWWGDAPMVVYTWIESHDWQGKTVIPFCTHEGSGLSSSPDNIAKACAGATVAHGFDMHGSTAQKQPEKAKKMVGRWLNK